MNRTLLDALVQNVQGELEVYPMFTGKVEINWKDGKPLDIQWTRRVKLDETMVSLKPCDRR